MTTIRTNTSLEVKLAPENLESAKFSFQIFPYPIIRIIAGNLDLRSALFFYRVSKKFHDGVAANTSHFWMERFYNLLIAGHNHYRIIGCIAVRHPHLPNHNEEPSLKKLTEAVGYTFACESIYKHMYSLKEQDDFNEEFSTQLKNHATFSPISPFVVTTTNNEVENQINAKLYGLKLLNPKFMSKLLTENAKNNPDVFYFLHQSRVRRIEGEYIFRPYGLSECFLDSINDISEFKQKLATPAGKALTYYPYRGAKSIAFQYNSSFSKYALAFVEARPDLLHDPVLLYYACVFHEWILAVELIKKGANTSRVTSVDFENGNDEFRKILLEKKAELQTLLQNLYDSYRRTDLQKYMDWIVLVLQHENAAYYAQRYDYHKKLLIHKAIDANNAGLFYVFLTLHRQFIDYLTEDGVSLIHYILRHENDSDFLIKLQCMGIQFEERLSQFLEQSFFSPSIFSMLNQVLKSDCVSESLMQNLMKLPMRFCMEQFPEAKCDASNVVSLLKEKEKEISEVLTILKNRGTRVNFINPLSEVYSDKMLSAPQLKLLAHLKKSPCDIESPQWEVDRKLLITQLTTLKVCCREWLKIAAAMQNRLRPEEKPLAIVRAKLGL